MSVQGGWVWDGAMALQARASQRRAATCSRRQAGARAEQRPFMPGRRPCKEALQSYAAGRQADLKWGMSSGAPPVMSTVATLARLAAMSATQRSATRRSIISVRLRVVVSGSEQHEKMAWVQGHAGGVAQPPPRSSPTRGAACLPAAPALRSLALHAALTWATTQRGSAGRPGCSTAQC